MKSSIRFIFLALLLLAFLTTGFFIGRNTALFPSLHMHSENTAPFFEKRAASKEFFFINPLWECDCSIPSELNSVTSLRNELKNYVSETIAAQRASHISIYFRDLNNGPWVGIKEKENFSPASLLKLPVLIAALKKCETDTGFLRSNILFPGTGTTLFQPNIAGAEVLQPGNTYTLEDLLFRMIAYSDNNAMDLIVKTAGGEFCANVMMEIGVDTTGLGSTRSEFVSVKDYSSFFRLLYNATYLNKELSEKALNILSRTGFDNGIVAGVPQGITVSHKFGERAYLDSPVKQLHDCGIIYYPNSPYLLCVMTRGTDFNTLTAVIADVSRIVFDNVDELQAEQKATTANLE